MSEQLQDFFRRIVGPTDEEFDRNARVMRLATYNAEVARGIVHTDDWRDFMRREQEWFDNPFSSAHNTGRGPE